MYFFIRETIPKLDLKLALSSLKLGLPVMVSAIFGIVINYSDRFFLEKYTSLKELSTYFLALSCASVIPMIFTSFQNAWLPIFLKEKDFSKNIIKTRKLMFTLFAIFIGISIAIIIFMKLILVLGIIKQEYNQVMFILPILLLSQSVSSIVPLYTNYLVYFEKTYIASITGFIISIISLALSISLIPRFGVYGAATVSFCSNIFYLLIYFLIIKTYKKKYITSTIQA
jgi:O-antigen/teichoic acid export membrane protein